MTASERKTLLAELASSQAQLLQLVSSLTPQQWAFHESPDRWSIAEIVEHLIVFEGFVGNAIAKALAEPPQPEKKALAPGNEPRILGLASSRHTKIVAREAARPTGRWTDPDQLIAEFRKARTQTMAFVTETNADHRSHFFAHLIFSDLDCYQWLILLSSHIARHAAQIEEIAANPAYPS